MIFLLRVLLQHLEYMQLQYDFSIKYKIYYVTPHGDLTIKNIIKYCKDLADDNELIPETVVVVSLDKVKNYLFHSYDALIIPRYYEELKKRKILKGIVLIGESELHFGIARMFQIIFDINHSEVVFVARNLKEAAKILKQNIP